MARSAAARRGVALVAVLFVLVAGTAVPAAGHASGELPTAELSADGPRVVIDYVAPPDDAAVIGTTLGYLGEGAMAALLGGPDDDLPTADEIAALSASSALREYLEQHVAVTQDGRPCTGRAEPAEDFLADGARLEFRCPQVVEQADVRITVLHDEDRAYRTFSVDGTAQYAIHSAAAPEHTWDFTLAAPAGGPDVVLLGAGGAVILALIGAVVALPRRRRSREDG